jgi:hypothetical protein
MAESLDKQDGNSQYVKQVIKVDIVDDMEENVVCTPQGKVIVINKSEGPVMPDSGDVRIKVYKFSNDSIDTIIMINPGSEMEWEEKAEFEWQQEEMEELIKAKELELEAIHIPEPFEWTTDAPSPPVKQSEKIIRQELRDDGLTVRGKEYIVELDSKAMYINGEKQPKEIYRKYSKLVESLEAISLEADDTFKMIF